MSRNRVKRIQKLLPIEEIGKNNIVGGKSAEVAESLTEGLPIISCECGAQILVVPDLQAMNRAIETHVAEHRKQENGTKNVFSSGRISQLLSQLALAKISEQNNIVS
jgi:hypothetical protein